jgi:DNA-binding MarR family transcriptional regulator
MDDAVDDPGELIDLYMRGARRLGGSLHRAAVQHDLTVMQAMALLHVGAGTVPTKEIARHLRCDPSNATGLVDQLERRALVHRVTPAHDRRVRAVEATPQGAEVLAELHAAMKTSHTVLDRLTPADRAELRRILTVLTAGPEED